MNRYALMAMVALSSGEARALVLEPHMSEIANAVRVGVKMAKPSQGYSLKNYVIYEVKDARSIDPQDGEVDAILLATPLERIRHAAFVAASEGTSISPIEARQMANLANHEIEIVVYAHGEDGHDRAFVARFGTALLVGPTWEISAQPTISDPSRTIYPLAQSDRVRFVGTVTYHFDLAHTAATEFDPVRLEVTDGSGKVFKIPLSFRKFH